MVINFEAVYESLTICKLKYAVGRNMESITMINEYTDAQDINVFEIRDKCVKADRIDVVINISIQEYAQSLRNKPKLRFSIRNRLYGRMGVPFCQDTMEKIKELKISMLGLTTTLYNEEAVKVLSVNTNHNSRYPIVRIPLTLYELRELGAEVELEYGKPIELKFN